MKRFLILGLLFTLNSFAKTYTIKKGNHYSSGVHVGIFHNDELNIKVTFDDSAKYKNVLPANQWAVNKLFGFSDCSSSHHKNSARFGWRWVNSKLELMAYNYVNSQRLEIKLGDMGLNQAHDMKIKIKKAKYIFSFNGKDTEMARGCSSKKANGYKLYPYFGGSETAPQEIKIKIDKE